MNAWIFLAHLKLAHELRKDTKEGLSVGSFAVFSKERGSFAEFFHSSLLQGLQRLDCWMTVFQEVLDILESRDTKVPKCFYWICFRLHFSVPCTSLWQFCEGYTHDDSKTVLSRRRHLLTGRADVLDGCMKVIQIWCDSPLVHYRQMCEKEITL